MKKTLSLLLFVSVSAWGYPKHLEVWFLSIDRTSFVEELIPKTQFSPLYSRQKLQCQQMGDYCFDPQVGLYKRGEGDKVEEALDYQQMDKLEEYSDAGQASSIDREFIKCDKDSSFFDVFCGKAKKQKMSKSKLEIWVDISSTMKQVDFDGFDKMCRRESFLRTINDKCPLNKKMKVYMFDESRRELGAFDRVCLNAGLNQVDRIIRDIKTSKAKNLIIITDIFEADEKFINFIEVDAKGLVRGVDKPLYAKDIKKDIDRMYKMCK